MPTPTPALKEKTESLINELGIVWHSQEQCDRAKQLIAEAILTDRKAVVEELVGVVPERHRPPTFSRSEEDYNEGLENGWNAARFALLEKAKALGIEVE